MPGELLLELLSEEIPARMQRRAIEDLSGLIRDKLAAAEIPASNLRGYVTPRRLAVIADGIPARQPDRREERRGPRVGAPPQALEGFLRATGLASIEQCEMRDTGRGEFYFAIIEQAGRPSIEVLPELIRAAIGELPWPKSMRFPAASLRWVRPLSSVICLFDGIPLAFSLEPIPPPPPIRADPRYIVPVARTTRGHRFLSPGEIMVESAADYLDALERAHVVLDQDRRRDIIRADLDKLAASAGVAVKPDPGLLDEVTGLVEYPVVLMGTIDNESMALPPEVLATAMRTHQKYFSCLSPDGTAAPRFLFVANNLTPDDGKTVIAGNERVLRARLADARFFWDQDRKIRLEDRVEALKDCVYHAKLGSVYDKVGRVEKLAVFIAEQLAAQPTVIRANDQSPGTLSTVMAGLDPAIHEGSASRENVDARIKPGHDDDGLLRLAQRAAHLAKADLSTGMVGEFPELQGVMGRYYALRDGEDPQVADAIAEHYKPLGPTDTCPTVWVSVVVALADKIDTLAAFFSIDERPTGSRDPFALRRAAQGVIRLILENRLRLPLAAAFESGAATLGDDATKISSELLEFIADRLKVHLRGEGAAYVGEAKLTQLRHDLIAAVFALEEDDLVRLLTRAVELAGFLATEDGSNLLIAYRRASNIVAIEERRDGRSRNLGYVENLLCQPEEVALAKSLELVSANAQDFLEQEKFEKAMAALAMLRAHVDAFFDKVTVNTDDKELRENRLRLLSRIRAVMNQVADFSQIEG